MSTYTLAFGDCAENHVGMQKIGELAAKGFSLHNLIDAQKRFKDYKCELVMLSVPLLETVQKDLPGYLRQKAANLNVEGNHYYDVEKCGIGFHGDSERRKVVAIRLGNTAPLHYQWFSNGKPVGDRIKLVIEHGDMYVMSEKATGWDWKRKTIYTLRHAAGCEKYTTIN